MNLYCTVAYRTPGGKTRVFTHTSPTFNERPEALVYYTLRDHTNTAISQTAKRKLYFDILNGKVTSPHRVTIKQGKASVPVTISWYVGK